MEQKSTWNKIKEEIVRILKYQVSGFAVIATDWCFYFLLNSLFGGFEESSRFKYFAQIISFTLGAIVSYAINRKWTFGTQTRFLSRKMLEYIFLNLLALFAGEGVLILCNKVLMLYGTIGREFIAKVLVDACAAVIIYLGTRLWIFREKKPEKAA